VATIFQIGSSNAPTTKAVEKVEKLIESMRPPPWKFWLPIILAIIAIVIAIWSATRRTVVVVQMPTEPSPSATVATPTPTRSPQSIER